MDNNKPLFAKTPICVSVQISDANTNLDASGTTTVLFTAVKKTMITEIRYKAITSTLAGFVRVFITDSAGLNPRLFKEMTVGTVTITTSVASAIGSAFFDNLVLASGQKILVSTHNANTFNVFAMGGELED